MVGMDSVMLSPNFSCNEGVFSSTAIRKGIDNTPPENVLSNMRVAALGMEDVRRMMGHPCHVDSWFRCPLLNEAVNGDPKSGHMLGWCIDFICPKFGTPLEIVYAIAQSGMKFDKLIQEGTWVHISFDPRMRGIVLTAHFQKDALGNVIKTSYSLGA